MIGVQSAEMVRKEKRKGKKQRSVEAKAAGVKAKKTK